MAEVSDPALADVHAVRSWILMEWYIGDQTIEAVLIN